MCIGNLDPKLLTREVEARLADWPKRHRTMTEPVPPRDLKGWITALAGWFKGKEATHG